MIKATQLTKTDIQKSLSKDFITDTQPLIDYMGFAEDSSYVGLLRKTFSLCLSHDQVSQIHGRAQELYEIVIKDCWPEGEPIPFDMIRLDAYLTDENDIRVLEINARNAGMHEGVEWIDGYCAKQLNILPGSSLNQALVTHQKRLHDYAVGDGPLLFLSPPNIPQWLYFDEVKRQYSSVVARTTSRGITATSEGVVYDGQLYKAITKKFAWRTPSWDQLNVDKVIRIMQPRWMRPYGEKDYLTRVNHPSILQTRVFDAAKIADYETHKNALVLKIKDGGGSRDVHLGPDMTIVNWRKKLLIAAANPSGWVMQDYFRAAHREVIAHGKGLKSVAVQLGIFVLPDPVDPQKCVIDIALKGYDGHKTDVMFDPAGYDRDIWFGNVVVVK